MPTEAEIARKEGRDYETAEVLLERIKAEKGEKRKTDNILLFRIYFVLLFSSERPPASRSLSTRGPKKAIHIRGSKTQN